MKHIDAAQVLSWFLLILGLPLWIILGFIVVFSVGLCYLTDFILDKMDGIGL